MSIILDVWNVFLTSPKFIIPLLCHVLIQKPIHLIFISDKEAASTPAIIIAKTEVTKYASRSPSSCSGSVYLTPDGGCMTEINECYQSNDNLSIDDPLNGGDIIRRPLARTDSKYNLRRRSISKNLLFKLNELTKLSISLCESVSIEPADTSIDFKDSWNSISEMSVTPSDFRATTIASSSPIRETPLSRESNPDKGIFNIARVKKIELQNLSPKVSELSREYLKKNKK